MKNSKAGQIGIKSSCSSLCLYPFGPCRFRSQQLCECGGLQQQSAVRRIYYCSRCRCALPRCWHSGSCTYTELTLLAQAGASPMGLTRTPGPLQCELLYRAASLPCRVSYYPYVFYGITGF